MISSHRLDEVAALVNRVVEMDQGRIVLNDHVDDQVDMSSMLDSKLTLAKASAFAETVREWGFVDTGEGLVWHGQVAGPDRLRFLGVLSRYAALLKGIQLQEARHEGKEGNAAAGWLIVAVAGIRLFTGGRYGPGEVRWDREICVTLRYGCQ